VQRANTDKSPSKVLSKPTFDFAASEPDLLEKDFSHLQESKISKTYSERITKTVILIILGMLFFQPLFDPTTFYSANSSYQYSVDALVIMKYAYNGSTNNSDFEQLWD
jgi:hypothetical protein